MNQLQKAVNCDVLFDVALMIGWIRRGFDFRKSDKFRTAGPALPDDMIRSRVVRHAVDPSSKRTTCFESIKTSPHGELHFLGQVATLFRIRFICAYEPVERRAVWADRVLK
jgi:hypothetical protein